jgi:acetyl esterase/lipase
MDTKGVKTMLKMAMPGISYSKKFYLKKTEAEISLELIEKLMSDLSRKDYQPPTVKSEMESFLISGHHYLKSGEKDNVTEVRMESGNLRNSPSKLRKVEIKLESKPPMSQSQIKDSQLLLNNLKGKNPNDYVKIKLLSQRQFFIPQYKNFWSCFTCCVSTKNFNRDSLIIHIHGGGFIAMSPSSHENYTRKWVNMLEVPMISIDYRLAPEHPYPKALDDVYQAYMWAINYAEEILQINVEKIILVGDSAGGNLVLGLTYLLIMLGKKLPTAIFCVYPGIYKN